MNLLSAINGILPVLGEHTVTSIDSRNPALAVIIPNIELEVDNISRGGLWFNTFDTTLYPDTEKFIAVPSDALSVVPLDATVYSVQRGLRLLNASTNDYLWDAPIDVRLITRVAFDELPESVQSCVFYSALVAAYATDIGLEGSIQLWQAKARASMQDLTREHLRNRRHSISKSVRFAKLRSSMTA